MAGSGAEDDQVGGLESAELIVEVAESGGDAGDLVASVVESFEAFESAGHKLVDGAGGALTLRWPTSNRRVSAWSRAAVTSPCDDPAQ